MTVNIWANEACLTASILSIIGGVCCIAGQYNNWQVGISTLSTGCITVFLEYARGEKEKGITQPRLYQNFSAKVISACQPFMTNYFVRFVIYLIFSLPSLFAISTVFSGLTLMFGSILYLLAALKEFEWIPPQVPDLQKELSVMDIPTVAPPRASAHQV